MSGVQTPSVVAPTSGASAGAAPTVLGQVTVTQLPDKLTGLARALAVSGMVTEQRGDQATLRTAAGDVQVRSDQPLPTDRPVTLQIPAQTSGAALTATALAQSASQATGQTAGGAAVQTAAAQTQTAGPAATLPVLQVGTTLAAVLLSPAPAGNATASGPVATATPPSDVSQGQGLGLIVRAQGDTGDQPDLTDDRQPPSQPAPTQPAPSPTTAASPSGTQGGASQPTPTPQPGTATDNGGTPAVSSPPTTGGQTASAAPAAPGGNAAPSLADLLPDIAPPLAAQTQTARAVPADLSSWMPAPDTPEQPLSSPTATPTPAPAPAAPGAPGGASNPASPPPSATPGAGAAPGGAPPRDGAPAPTVPPSPSSAAATPPPPAAAPLGQAATRLAALGQPGFLPDLGAKAGGAAPAQAPGAPAPRIMPSAGDDAPFVAGSLFLNTRPSFVRTGLPSGTAAPFSPLPAVTPPPSGQASGQAAAPPPAPAGAPSTSPAAPVPRMNAPVVPALASSVLASSVLASSVPGVSTGQAGPPSALGGGSPSVLGVPTARPTGMAPAATLLPGALAPQAAELTSATVGPTASAAPAAVAYATPLRAAANPAPVQTVSFTLVSIQPPDADHPGMGESPTPGILPPEDPVTDPAIRPGVAPTVPGTVVGLTRAGQPVVETPRGTFLLHARTDLPLGTKVDLAPAATPVADLDAPPPPIDPARGRDWPALREALAVIAAANPALARQLIESILPRPTPQLTKTLVIFLAALRGGDAGGWLGSEAMSTLGKAGRGRLSARLADDFSSIAAQASEPNKEGWRTYAVPFGDEVGRLQVHVRAINDEDGNEEEGGPARAGRARPLRRFLIDLHLSQLGPMQLDGLIWTGRFDLVIRTRQLLPTSLTRELHGIYSNSLAAVGYSGGLSFQTGAHGWVDHAIAPTGGAGAGPITRI
ncbi:hypothetical protein [Nitrospirillum iridis]|uniref:Uncharacterized protein n=1 Tax=Nitrospirillum iridis TaxID=765888 RepID=A0A7X0ED78_9PROT|nr:hypothetical protein [Nitrospirillum iridis]MBB6250049.1 hypothetical protein [Nitrospirillum iridis]